MQSAFPNGDPHSPLYDFTLAEPQGVSYAALSDINNAGIAVGFYSDAAGQHAMEFLHGHAVTLAPPGAQSSTATDISDNGMIIGSAYDGSHYEGFLYSHGRYQLIDKVGAFQTQVLQVSNTGRVMGNYFDPAASSGASGPQPRIPFHAPHAFIYQNGVITTLGPATATQSHAYDMNASGEVVGTYTDPNNVQHAFVYAHNVLTPFNVAGWSNATPTTISDSGKIAGSYTDGNGTSHAFLYDHGRAVSLPIPTDAMGSYANDVNNAGQVAGTYTDGSGYGHAFIYDHGALKLIDPAGSDTSNAVQINERGQLLGQYSDTIGQHAFIYDKGSIVTVEPTGTSYSYADAINDAGTIALSVYDPASGNSLALIASPHPRQGHANVSLQDLLAAQVTTADLLPAMGVAMGALTQSPAAAFEPQPPASGMYYLAAGVGANTASLLLPQS